MPPNNQEQNIRPPALVRQGAFSNPQNFLDEVAPLPQKVHSSVLLELIIRRMLLVLFASKL